MESRATCKRRKGRDRSMDMSPTTNSLACAPFHKWVPSSTCPPWLQASPYGRIYREICKALPDYCFRNRGTRTVRRHRQRVTIDLGKKCPKLNGAILSQPDSI